MDPSKLRKILDGLRRRIVPPLKRPDTDAEHDLGPEVITPDPIDVPINVHISKQNDPIQGDPDPIGDHPEEINELVRRTFYAILRREPDQETLAAYREGFSLGTNIRDLVEDLISSDEYKTSRDRDRRLQALINTTPNDLFEPVQTHEMEATVTLLEMRLAEKGCRFQFGAVEQAIYTLSLENRRRMRGLRLTLALVVGANSD